MRRLVLLILLLSGTFFVTAQQDTVYVLYQEVESNYLLKLGKHRNDPELKTHYPFDGGRHYNMLKKPGKFRNRYTFAFNSYTPKWMDHQFSYQVVENCIFSKKDFKGAAWFDSKTGDEIISTFSGRDKFIYLIDETEITDNKKIYMVRVYFGFDAEE